MFGNSVQVQWVMTLGCTLLLARPVLGEENTAIDESSRGHRSRSTYSLEVQPVGFSDGMTTGIIAEYYKKPDMHLALKYEHGEELRGVFDPYEAKSDLIALTAKEYTSNSFFLEAGVGLRRKYIHRKSDVYVQEWIIEESRYTKTDLGFLIGLGNQWQWSHFTIGCEWVGLYIPAIATRVKGSKVETRNDGSESHSSLDRHDKRTRTTLRLLNFHFGVAF